MDFVRMFQEGGWTIYVVLLLALATHPLSVVVAIAAFVVRRRGLVIGLAAASTILAISTACVGTLAYFYWLGVVDEAVAFADPASAELLRSQGQREASWNWICGALAAAVPTLVSGIALVRGAMMRGPARNPTD